MGAIDIFKTIAVIAVVFIHVFSFYYYDQSMIFADQIMRFSVPVFVALSGFGLMLGYGQKKLGLRSYLLRRLAKLLPWYLFFATVIILAINFFFHENAVLYRDAPLWRLYLLGRADFHLYFVPMIAQFYLLFPLLLVLFKKFRPGIVILAALLWQLFWYVLIGARTEIVGNDNRIFPDQQQYLTFASWLFYFVLGMYLAYVKIKISWQFIAGAIIAVLGYILATTNSLELIGKGIDVLVATRFTRLPVLLYASGIIILGTSLLPLVKLPSRLGNIAYLVFLGHTLVLRFFFRTINLSASFGLVPMAIVIISTSFLVAVIFDIAGRRVYETIVEKFHR